MAVTVVTKAEFDEFKAEVVKSFSGSSTKPNSHTFPYLRTKEVLELLNICNTSLHNYVTKGLVSIYKFGGNNYYKVPEIEALIEAGKLS